MLMALPDFTDEELRTDDKLLLALDGWDPYRLLGAEPPGPGVGGAGRLAYITIRQCHKRYGTRVYKLRLLQSNCFAKV